MFLASSPLLHYNSQTHTHTRRLFISWAELFYGSLPSSSSFNNKISGSTGTEAQAETWRIYERTTALRKNGSCEKKKQGSEWDSLLAKTDRQTDTQIPVTQAVIQSVSGVPVKKERPAYEIHTHSPGWWNYLFTPMRRLRISKARIWRQVTYEEEKKYTRWGGEMAKQAKVLEKQVGMDGRRRRRRNR